MKLKRLLREKAELMRGTWANKQTNTHPEQKTRTENWEMLQNSNIDSVYNYFLVL